VLIGILLGFGSQNSLLGSRCDFIDSLYWTSAKCPQKASVFFESSDLFYSFQEDNDLFSSVEQSAEPSLGYRTYEDEEKDLSQILGGSSDSLENYAPRFICGMDPSLEESKSLIKSYENTQINEHKLLQSEKFLEKVLARYGFKAN
jgi:hypothetical protein